MKNVVRWYDGVRVSNGWTGGGVNGTWLTGSGIWLAGDLTKVLWWTDVGVAGRWWCGRPNGWQSVVWRAGVSEAWRRRTGSVLVV